MDMHADLIRFYEALGSLEGHLGGKRTLAGCDGRMSWPARGVYFFFEPGEVRSDTGMGPRVVRVGTHALTASSRSSLWQRLSQHRGINLQTGEVIEIRGKGEVAFRPAKELKEVI
jgi:hypothetical protein